MLPFAFSINFTLQIDLSRCHSSALAPGHLSADTLHSPDFSAAVTQTIRSEIRSLQPPYSQSEESGSKGKRVQFSPTLWRPLTFTPGHRTLQSPPPFPTHTPQAQTEHFQSQPSHCLGQSTHTTISIPYKSSLSKL